MEREKSTMHYIKSLSQYEDSSASAVTFGKFDGLHMGHQKLVNLVSQIGKKERVNSIMCEFDMRPLWKSRGLSVEQLMTGQERYQRAAGKMDYLIECPFDEDFRVITAEDFIHDVIFQRFHAKYVVVGIDFRFGKDQGGDIHTLKRYEKEYGYQLIAVEKERYEGHIISSTYIREVLKEGNVPLANTLLGYRFQVGGCVESGKKLGRTLGFPTINLAWPKGKLVPPRGVYVTEVVLDGKRYPSISNIGVKPTVSSENRVTLESYLLDFSGDIYGKSVDVELLEFRRPERKFNTVDEMKTAVDQDIAYARKYFRMADTGECQSGRLFPYNIFLIGFMGVGKSTISDFLSTYFAMDVIEMDQVIAERERMSISDIFEMHGEEYFRQLETDLLIETQELKNVVVSCGGGVALREQNVEEMRKNGRIVLLTATPETILDRVKDSDERPILNGNKNVAYIRDLMERRREKYEEAADITIHTDGKDVEAICGELVEKLRGTE